MEKAHLNSINDRGRESLNALSSDKKQIMVLVRKMAFIMFVNIEELWGILGQINLQ